MHGIPPQQKSYRLQTTRLCQHCYSLKKYNRGFLRSNKPPSFLRRLQIALKIQIKDAGLVIYCVCLRKIKGRHREKPLSDGKRLRWREINTVYILNKVRRFPSGCVAIPTEPLYLDRALPV